MATFPALTPSSRTFTPGEYPNTAFTAWAGSQNRVRHSNVMLDSSLRLTFNVITETQMLSILSHYQGQNGTYESFALPSDVWSGVTSISDFELTNYRWCYTEPPSVTDLPCGNHIVELSLITVPPEGVSLNGLSSLMLLSISGGNVIVTNGLTKTIDWSFAPGQGDAPVNGNGITSSITTSITGGGPQITPAGINATVLASITGGTATGGGPTDPYFSSVSLLLHMDGSNNSTTFTDSSGKAFSVTPYGSAKISTAQSKFGGASGLLGGSGNYLSIANAAALQFGTGDFTIEFWINYISISGLQSILSKAGGSEFAFQTQTGNGRFDIYIGGSRIIRESGTGPAATWIHYALVRSGSTVTLYRDGVSSGTGTSSANMSTSFPLLVGDSSSGFNGYIDDLRITKGVARYTANFTPPTEAYPNG